MHDVKNRAAPVNILNIFQNTSDIHSYNTRSSKSNNFYIKQSKLEIQRKSFSHVGVKWWNEVPSCIRELPKRAFKKRIRSILLDILQNENTYPDIESHSCKIKRRSRNEASN